MKKDKPRKIKTSIMLPFEMHDEVRARADAAGVGISQEIASAISARYKSSENKLVIEMLLRAARMLGWKG